jgi:ketosteroid isomerase-like protein
MNRGRAIRFAKEWIAAWNAHDLDLILAHYTDDFEMSTPFIAKLSGEPSGTL